MTAVGAKRTSSPDAGSPKSQERPRFRGSQVDCRGKQVKHNGSNYSASLFADPAPTSTGAAIFSSANSPHPALVNAHGSGDGVPF